MCTTLINLVPKYKITEGRKPPVEMAWATVTAATRSVVRLPREGDVALTLYRDANAWCPHCHKVFWYMEQKGLRYTTERIHLQGDPREPAKPEWFLRDVNPGGGVPVLRIRDEIIPESLHILQRLQAEFPNDDQVVEVLSGDPWTDQILHACDYFDCDADEWLQNLDQTQEQSLLQQTRAKFGCRCVSLMLCRCPSTLVDSSLLRCSVAVTPSRSFATSFVAFFSAVLTLTLSHCCHSHSLTLILSHTAVTLTLSHCDAASLTLLRSHSLCQCVCVCV